MRSHRRQACFSRTVRITRKARCASAPAVRRHPPSNSANHRTPGSTARSAAAASHPIRIDSGTVCGCGSDAAARCTARSSTRPVGCIAFLLQQVQVSFHLRDTAGIPFSERLPEVHPAQLIGLRLQMVCLRVPRLLSFPAGRGSALS